MSERIFYIGRTIILAQWHTLSLERAASKSIRKKR